ncbi:MAG TPA: outer membrane beta-barrel protein [Woeseiaceae bacterium]|nr:outer membrane beta-barrel protein [Woeseiaceae bacterium]
MRHAILLLAAMLAGSLDAHAADNGIYLGAALSRSSIDTESDFFGFSYEDDDTAYKLIGGFRPLDSLAIEANYVDFGNIVFDNRDTVPDGFRSEYQTQAIDAFAVGFIGVPLVEVFGKIGVVYWDADAVLQGGISGVDLRDSDSGADLAYGGGVQAHLGSLSARLEYEKFEMADTEKTGLWSLGLTYTFF